MYSSLWQQRRLMVGLPTGRIGFAMARTRCRVPGRAPQAERGRACFEEPDAVGGCPAPWGTSAPKGAFGRHVSSARRRSLTPAVRELLPCQAPHLLLEDLVRDLLVELLGLGGRRVHGPSLGQPPPLDPAGREAGTRQPSTPHAAPAVDRRRRAELLDRDADCRGPGPRRRPSEVPSTMVALVTSDRPLVQRATCASVCLPAASRSRAAPAVRARPAAARRGAGAGGRSTGTNGARWTGIARSPREPVQRPILS